MYPETKTHKTPSETAVVTRQVVMPQHANPLNTLFGGVLVSWIDQVAGMVAVRYGASPAAHDIMSSFEHLPLFSILTNSPTHDGLTANLALSR